MITYSKYSAEQRIKLPKISLRCTNLVQDNTEIIDRKV